MRPIEHVPRGSLVADHRHTYTAERFYYRVSYRCENDHLVWSAEIRRGAQVVDELQGTALLDHSRTSPLTALRNAVESAIDRRAFFETELGRHPAVPTRAAA